MKGIIRIRTILGAATILAVLPMTGLFAQVSRAPATTASTGRVPLGEAEVRNTPRVNFINRNNRRASEAQRRAQIGLGQALARDVVAQDTGNRSRIKIDRVFEGRAAGMGADVFSVQPGATYGHINGIQRVLTGYLVQAFEYSPADAAELSRFILYYNANNRGNMDKVKATYSPRVAAAVNAETVGIDRSFRNWAGRTQILIPLRKNILRPGDKDIEGRELKKATQDLPAGERKKLEEIIDRRNQQDAAKLSEEKKEIAQRQEEIKNEQNEVEGELADTQRKLEELRKDPEANAEEIKKEEAKQEELEEKQEELAAEETKNEERAEEVAQQEAENNSEEVAAEEPDTKQEEIEQKEEEIAALKEENEALKEEKKEQEEKTENVVGEKILFLRVVRYLKDGHYKNELWAIDSANDDALYRSGFNNICGREFKVTEQGILVAGYKGEFPGHEHVLVMLDSEDLSLKTQTKEQVYWQTPTIVKDGKIYAIIRRGEQFFLGRFNPDLTLDVASDKPISKHSTISLVPGKVYVTGKTEGDRTQILVFNQEGLKQTKTITPKLN